MHQLGFNRSFLNHWYGYNNCNSSPTTTPLPNINTVDGSTVEQITYSGGDNGSSVEHFKVNGGGHDWPGVWGNMDMNASIEIWKFFSKYNLADLSVVLSVDDGDFKELLIHPNPVSNLLTIDNPFTDSKPISITNQVGQIVYTGFVSKANNQINVESLSPNVYFVRVGEDVIKFIKL